MKRTLLVYAMLAATAAFTAAQEASQSSPYTGTSNPPSEPSIPDSATAPPPGVTGYEQPAPIPPPKPSPAQPAAQAPAPQTGQTGQPAAVVTQPAPMTSPMAEPADGTDDGIVQIAPSAPSQPALNTRASLMNDPDGDIVHPEPLPAGELGDGATIRVRLLDRVSSATSEPGEPFRTRVASDVIQDGQVLIPAGAEIDGTIVGVSQGHAGGHGSIRLRPETVILPDGSRFHLYAELSGAPDANVRVNGEGGVSPGSRLKKDGIEYGGAVGAGAVTGAILGGPGGALAGTIIGAGVITAHLMVSHPQATLDSGTVLLFTLDRPLDLVPATQTGN